MPQVSHHFVVDRPIDAVFELGPQVSAAMQAQSAEGITSLAHLVQRLVPGLL